MLRRLRARAIDGATMLARYLDARRERDRLRETVEFLCDERDEARRERDEYARLVATREVEIDELLRLRREVERLTAERDEQAQGVSVLACRIDRVQQERDAARAECGRLREALDLNQRSREASNAGHELLRRELSALLTGDDVPLEPVDIVERVRAAIAERDARIPTDIDGAQAWAEAHGMAVGHDHAGWHCRDEHDGGMVAGGGRAWVVGQAVGRVLSRTWRGDA